MKNNTHIPWYIKNPNSFGAYKAKMLCMIAKRLLGNNIFIILYKNNKKLNISAKIFNNKGYCHGRPLYYICDFAKYSSKPLIRTFFTHLYPYIYRNNDIRYNMVIEYRNIFNKYDAILTWYTVCNSSKNELKKILNEFENEIINITKNILW